jgi:hypothetical protein
MRCGGQLLIFRPRPDGPCHSSMHEQTTACDRPTFNREQEDLLKDVVIEAETYRLTSYTHRLSLPFFLLTFSLLSKSW